MQDWDEAERVRQRLAHHLHDGPIQELTAAQLFLDGLALRMETQDVDPGLRESLDRGLAALRNATVGCRRLMDSLRPGLEGEGELAERMTRLVNDVAPQGDAELSVLAPPGFGRAETGCALALYRALEDVLEQVRRGPARLRRVDLLVRDGRAELAIALREGRSFDAGAEDLELLGRRLKRLGGMLELADNGHTVLIELPVPASAAEGP